MSRPFWFAAFFGAVAIGGIIRYWADSNLDVAYLVSIFIWTLFGLALIDISRTTPRPPSPRNP